MKKTGKIVPVILTLAAAFSLGGADLVTLDGRTYRDFQVRKIGGDSLTVAFLNDRAEPDCAEIPFRDLPEDIRRLYPAASRPAAAKRGEAGAASASGGEAVLSAELDRLFRAFADARAQLAPDDRAGRAGLAAQVRRQTERLLARYGCEADCDFVALSATGIVVRVIGTPAGSPLRSGMYLDIAGGKQPASRSFRGIFYPTELAMPSAGYGTLPLYGADVRQAAAAVLERWAGTVGDPLFFAAAAESRGDAGGAAAPALQINQQIYVESRRPDWWYPGFWPRGIVIRPDRPGRRDRHDRPDDPGKNVPPGQSGGADGPSRPPGGAAPASPRSEPSAPVRAPRAPERNYGLLPEWAVPGR